MSSMSNKNATTLPGKKLSKQQKLPTNYSNKYVKDVINNLYYLEKK